MLGGLWICCSTIFVVSLILAVDADVRELIPLDAPENLTLIDIGDRDVMIMWDPVNKTSVRGTFRGYIVRVWNYLQTQVYAIPPDVTNTAVQFFPYSKNFITVSVRNDKYVGPRSAAISFDAPQTEPGYPLLFEWSQLGEDSILLQWNKPKQPNGILIGYNVYASETKDWGGIDEKTTIHHHINDPDKFQVKVTGLKEGRKYQVDLAAVNCAGESEHNTLELELEPHTSEAPSIPFFKYQIDYKPVDSLKECLKPTVPVVTAAPPNLEINFNDFDDDYFIFNDTETGKIVTTKKPKIESPTKKVESDVDPCLVDCMVTWVPDVDNVPGDHFYVKYRQRGTKEFNKTDPIKDKDYVVLNNFNGCQSYEIILVAVDGDYETESDLQFTPAVLFMTYF
ncbi:neuroglian isoform X2 [Aethina tumida]|uniref:neuroglian isoform X2 n=1 Tax=Aethina tumida TaxID=116153 RepID=UPI00096B1CE9|nr:neuroglian isoform X2 [Aethina tumida]